MPRAPLQALITLHFPISLVLLRSAVIRSDYTLLTIMPVVVEGIYWSALISLPYGESMTRLLKGGKSKGGGSTGSFGKDLPRHPEEPSCTSNPLAHSLIGEATFSRSTYTFLIPLLFKHWFTPITLDDIPAIREDDSSTTSIASFRADQAKRDKTYAARHGGAKRQRNLGWDLLAFFSPDILTQCVSSAICGFPTNMVRYGRRSLSACSTFPRRGCACF